MKTLNRKTWFLAAALVLVGARAQAADWGLIMVSPIEGRTSVASVAPPKKTPEPDCAQVRTSPKRMAAKILAKAEAAEPTPVPAKPKKITMKERIAESDRIAALGGNNRADRLALAAYAAANRPRDIAPHKKRRMHLSLKRKYVLSGITQSKGWCARAVREALAEAGIRISGNDAHAQRPTLLKNGFKKVAYDPYNAKPGTVLVCNGGRSGFGHMEIAIERSGHTMFCSDFCSEAPTCSSGRYSKASAFELPGA